MIYQIFVDRFASLDQKCNVKPWDLPVEGAANEFYGGNLKGIISKIDHISSLGADAIYITPIFESKTYHRYDILDYFQISPMVGDERDLENLIKAFHSRKIKIFLDGVFNHVSSESKMVSNMGTKRKWRGFGELTELDLDRPDVMKFILNVVEYWMKKDIDGFRIDCANDVGMSHLDEIMSKIHEFGGQMVGEVMTYAKDWLYHMDGVMNYFFRQSTLLTLNSEITPDDYVTYLNWMINEYPQEKLLNSWTILSSHDTPRLSNVLQNEKKIRLAIAIQHAFPGIPMIYYGEEVGMNGGPDPFNRAPMNWEQKSERCEFYQKMNNLRKEFDVLSKGKTKIWINGDILSILRYDEWERFVLFVANPTGMTNVANVIIPYSYAFDGLEMRDVISNRIVKINSGSIFIDLEPFDFTFFVPKGDISNYSFFKKR